MGDGQGVNNLVSHPWYVLGKFLYKLKVIGQYTFEFDPKTGKFMSFVASYEDNPRLRRDINKRV